MILWIVNNISESISKSILYVQSANEIWKHLEKCFSLSNGSRKYKLNKDLYELKKNKASISEYYTRMKEIWEEWDAMSVLFGFTILNEEITKFLKH